MNTLRQSRWMRPVAFLSALGGLAWFSGASFANPLGEVVIHGDVGFARNGSTLDIMQGSSRAIIEWQSFNIAGGESTIFHQPGASAVALNRVVGGSSSFLDGLLQANGNVFLVNPSGIILGRNSRVDVNGLLLSTLDVSNDEFLRGGDMTFSGGSNAPIVNFGTINAAQGNVFVFAQNVENHGRIGAVDGHVVMMGSNEVLLHSGGRTGNVSVKGTVGYGHVVNGGELEGSSITMEAVNNNAMAMAVQQKGTARITGAEKRNGRVLLVAHGGAGLSQEGTVNTGGGAVRMQADGQVQIGGTTDASSSDGQGGRIEVIGREINVTPLGVLRSNGTSGGAVKVDATEKLEFQGTLEAVGSAGRGGTASLTGNEVTMRAGAVADASGATGGGEVFVGGGFQGASPALRNATNTIVETGATIRASATQSGDGGVVAVWANGRTDFKGSVFAEGVNNGGMVEVSGREVLGFDGAVSTLGRDGQNGLLLLDPRNVTISRNGATPGSISDAALELAWLNNNVVVHTYDDGASDPGDVNIEEFVTIRNPYKYSSNSFSIFAHGNINVGTQAADGPINIRHWGTGNINLVAGWNPGSTNPFATPIGTIGGSSQALRWTGPISTTGLLSGFYGEFGHGGAGTIQLNPATNMQSQINIGSAGGDTNLLAGSLIANAGDATDDHVHIGWLADRSLGWQDPFSQSEVTTATGNVNVNLTQAIGASMTVNAGVQGRQYIQFGHGGHGDNLDAPNGVSLTGNVNITSPGMTLLQAGRGSNSYVIVGHGGRLLRNIRGTEADGVLRMDGDITVNAGQLIMAGGTGNAQNFVLIGHGGQQVNGPDVANPLTTRANITVNAPDGILMGGGRDDAFVQIGNGGWEVQGNHSGNIVVTSNKAIEMLAANPTAQFTDQSHVMIGHGGWDSDGTHTGDITVQSGASIRMYGGSGTYSFTQIGHGGTISATELGFPVGSTTYSGTATIGGPASGGNITVTAERDIVLQSNDGTAIGPSRQYVQIGHGGDDADGTRFGDIVVTANTGTITLNSAGLNDTLNNSSDAYTQIGLGGRDSSGDHAGNITVTAAGDITLQGGYENNRISLIGHGGRFDGTLNTSTSTVSTFTNNDGGLIHGDISVRSLGGKVSVTGGLATTEVDYAGVGDITFAMIGHSLFSAKQRSVAPAFSSSAWGNIDVTASTGVAVQGGNRDWSFAAIGHGVHNSSDEFVFGDPALGRLANISVTTASGDISVKGGGYSGFDSTTSEYYRYGAIGHHAANATFDSNANILVNAQAGNVIVEGGTQRFGGARIGHGGDVLVQGANRQHVMTGNIDVRAMAGKVSVLGGTGYTPEPGRSNRSNLPEQSYAMIGHGGARLGQTNFKSFLLGGNIEVDSLNVDVLGGDGSGNFAAIGHGGYQRGDTTAGSLYLAGNVLVNAVYDVEIDGGDALSNSIFDSVTLDQDEGFRNRGNFGQIGHFGVPLGNTGSSGSASRVTTSGDVTVKVQAGQDIGLNRRSYLAGASWGRGAHAMIGVGGNGYASIDSGLNVPTMDIMANVDVAAGRDIYLYGATTGRTMIETGGGEWAPTTIAPGPGSFAQIGNGGAIINSGLVGIGGDISVRTGGNLLLQTGVTGNPATASPLLVSFDSYAKIGNGDFLFQSGARPAEGFRSGDIEVATGGNAVLVGALIGHVDPRFSNAVGLAGSTFVGVDRLDATGPTGGALIAVANSEGVNSAIEANVIGELRIYTPTREQNRIAESTYLNNVTLPYSTYDHPGMGAGDSGVPLLRVVDEAYDKNLVFTTFNEGFTVGATPYSFAKPLPQGAFNRAAPYTGARNYMVYYNDFTFNPPVIPPPPLRLPDLERDDLPPDDQYDLPETSFGGPIWSTASRLAGVSSTYPEGSVQEDLVGFSVGQTVYRPFEVFDWRALMDWQSGGVTYVPGMGFVAKPKPDDGAPGGAPVPPVPGAGTAVPTGEKAFDFDFGPGGVQDDEAKKKKDAAAAGGTEPQPDTSMGVPAAPEAAKPGPETTPEPAPAAKPEGEKKDQ